MSLLIVGGGRFGIKAIEYAKEKNYSAILIDNDSQCQAIKFIDKQFNNFDDFKHSLRALKKKDIWFIEQNVEIINEILSLIDIDYIIPVIPIHLMAFIISIFFKKYSINFVPGKEDFNEFIRMSDKNLILSSNVQKGIVYLSHAKYDEICPDNCIGPPKFCPHFKREKNITITRYLREYFNLNDYLNIKEDDSMRIFIILESYQLKPGLGGLLATEVKNILKILHEKLSIIVRKKCKIIIATACNCHGVLNFLEKNYN